MNAPPSPLRILVAGAGAFGREHLDRLVRRSDATVVGVADTNAAALELACARHGVANLGDQRTATATACRAGLVTVGSELGGGGRASSEALKIGRRGVRNVLAHLGVLDDAPQLGADSARQILELRGTTAYVYAPADGVLETFHALGATVRAGEPAGRIHRVWELAHEPETITYGCDGILFARRQPGRVRPGNCCVVVASPV